MKRFLSLFLSLVMIFGVVLSVPLTVNAASIDDLKFKLNSDGKSYAVTECNQNASGEIVVPSTYNGKPVTSIDDRAFYYCESITSVTIHDGVTSIGLGAFSYCKSLSSITIPGSVNSISAAAFDCCYNLDTVYITNITAWCNINFGATDANPMYYAKNLYINGSLATDVVIPDGTTSIGRYAFFSCKSFKSITIPDTVTRIDLCAFYDCTQLASITISDNVLHIGVNAFGNTGYYKNKNNWENGVLYINNYLINTDDSISGSLVIKPGTKIIADGAASHRTKLTSVTIPDSVTNIGESAFEFCTKLTKITILGSTTSIGDYAMGCFFDCYDEHNHNKNCYSKVSNFTIWGLEGSTAETYAKENEFIFIDINHQPTLSCWIIDIAATCTKKGSKHKECTVCATVLETEEIPATGHMSSKWITDKKATVNAAGSKHKECTECKKILGTATIPQLKPGRTTVKATTTSTGVKITWSKVTGVDKYTVYRKIGDGSYKAIKTVTGTSYTDTTAKSGTKYRYNVKAKNEAGYGEYAKSGVTKLFLATPKVTVSNASTGVTVKWNKITGAKGYYVYRKASGAKSWTKIATVKSGSTVSYTDKKASAGKKYYYTVKAYNGDYVSTTKASSIIERLKAPTIKTVTSGKSGVTVKWAKATGADGYYVYRKIGSGSYSKIATVKGNTKVTYLDKSAKKGKTYTYYVKAYSGKSVSTSSKTLKIIDKY